MHGTKEMFLYSLLLKCDLERHARLLKMFNNTNVYNIA